MFMSIFVGGWPGMEVSIFCFMSMFITMRSPNGHFSFNSTGPPGVLNLEVSSNFPDLLQPTQDRLNARVTATNNVFLFIMCFIKNFDEFSHPTRVRKLQNDTK